MRKIIQIAACSHYEENRKEGEYTMYALCDDGSVWWLDGGENTWWSVKPIPQPVQNTDTLESEKLARSQRDAAKKARAANALEAS